MNEGQRTTISSHLRLAVAKSVSRSRSRSAWRRACLCLAKRLPLAASLLMVGCVNHGTPLQSARQAFWAGDLQQAAEGLRKAQPRRGEPAESILADQALVALLQGDAVVAEQMLRVVRDRFESLESTDIRKSALSLVSDDRRLPYAGDDYEQVMIRSFLALANLMQGGQDVMAYCLQANQKQQQIIDAGVGLPDQNPKLGYKRVALSAYLYGTLQEATHHAYDEAARAYASVLEWNPDFPPAAADRDRVLHGSHSAPGNGVVYVIGLVGPGPYKQETTAAVTTEAMAIASQLLHALGDRDIPPLTAPVKIPQIVVPPSSVDALLVSTRDQQLGVTQTVTDVSQIAWQQAQASLNHTVARAVVRRIVKKSAVFSAKHNLASASPLAGLALDAAGFVWEASESADTRSWSLLPGTIQMLRIELPAGRHSLAVQPVFQQRVAGPAEIAEVEVIDGENSYLLACFPDRKLAGRILSSR